MEQSAWLTTSDVLYREEAAVSTHEDHGTVQRHEALPARCCGVPDREKSRGMMDRFGYTPIILVHEMPAFV